MIKHFVLVMFCFSMFGMVKQGHAQQTLRYQQESYLLKSAEEDYRLGLYQQAMLKAKRYMNQWKQPDFLRDNLNFQKAEYILHASRKILELPDFMNNLWPDEIEKAHQNYYQGLNQDEVSQQKYFAHYIKGCIGNLSTINLATCVDLSRTLSQPTYVEMSHISSSDFNSNKSYGQSNIQFTTEKELKNYKVDMQAGIDRNKQFYYGYDESFDLSSTDIKQVFTNASVSLNVSPQDRDAQILQGVSVYAGLYKDKFKANELTFKADIPMHKKLAGLINGFVNIHTDLNLYNVAGFKSQFNGLLQITPRITYEIEALKMKVGLYPTYAGKAFLLPDIQLQVPLLAQKVLLTTGFQSRIRQNTFKQMTEINPFIFNYFQTKPSDINDFYVRLDGHQDRVNFSVTAGYAVWNQMPIIINDTLQDGKQFNIGYDPKATMFVMDAHLNYYINPASQLGLHITNRPIIRLAHFEKAWNYRPLQFNVYGNYQATQQLNVGMDLILATEYLDLYRDFPGKNVVAKKIKPGLDLNLNATYTINKYWDVFIQGNNLFNSKYQTWTRYEQFGTNVQVGAFHSFTRAGLINNEFFNKL